MTTHGWRASSGTYNANEAIIDQLNADADINEGYVPLL